MDEVRRYLETTHPPPHPLLLELEERSRADSVSIVSREVGRLLSTLVTAMQANRILEVGTAYGYSTLWMALAQPSAGKIWTIEPNAARAEVAIEYFRRAGEDDYIEVFNTPPHELLENFPHRNLDIALVSMRGADYTSHLDLDLILPMLKLSGLVIFDEPDVHAMDEFNARFLAHPSLDATILLLDGSVALGARKR